MLILSVLGFLDRKEVAANFIEYGHFFVRSLLRLRICFLRLYTFPYSSILLRLTLPRQQRAKRESAELILLGFLLLDELLCLFV